MTKAAIILDNLGVTYPNGLVAVEGISLKLAIASKPAMSLEAQNNSVSTEANDLLFPVELSQYFTNVSGRTYQLGQLDLEQFCRDFPFNSQCEGTIPATEGETPLLIFIL